MRPSSSGQKKAAKKRHGFESKSPEKRSQPRAAPTQRQEPCGQRFPIVGVGASAGGLEAFMQLLGALPLDTGMAFVLVQHLDRDHESQLAQILSRTTALPVREIRNGEPVQANHVYVIPRDRTLTVAEGVLKIRPRERTRAPRRPIDSFFESLAQDRRELAVGVVLSARRATAPSVSRRSRRRAGSPLPKTIQPSRIRCRAARWRRAVSISFLHRRISRGSSRGLPSIPTSRIPRCSSKPPASPERSTGARDSAPE